jgi:hypothetical protein
MKNYLLNVKFYITFELKMESSSKIWPLILPRMESWDYKPHWLTPAVACAIPPTYPDRGVDFCMVTPSDWDHLIPGSSWSTPSILLFQCKVKYYNRALEATYQDIAYTQDTMLYDHSSSIVRRQLEKASALKTVVDYISSLQVAPNSAELLQNLLLAEHQLHDFADVFTLQHELGHLWYNSALTHDFTEKKKSTRIRRELLLRGRMLRRFFRRVVRDIRRFFRTLVRAIFKHMNDQSGNDEFMVRANFCRPSIHSPQNWSLHGQARNFSPH